MKVVPKIIKEVGFDFHWNVEKVWALRYPTEEIELKERAWHFEIPFWSKKGGFYDIAVLDPSKFEKEFYLKSKPILVGFELKLRENCSFDKAYELMENDSFAFDNRKNNKSAEFGFIFFINVDADNEDSERRRFVCS